MKACLPYIWTLFFLIPILPVGCELTSDGDCDCDAISDYDVRELAQAFVIGTDPVPNQDTTNVAAIGIQISFDLEEQPRRVASTRSPMSLFPAANACTCVAAFVRTFITELSITSSGSVNPEIPAGTELANLFTADVGQLEDGEYPIDLHYVLRQSGDDSPEGVVTLRILDLAPWEEGVHTFAVRMTLSDGQEFEEALNPIRIEKG